MSEICVEADEPAGIVLPKRALLTVKDVGRTTLQAFLAYIV
jgi:hypothetical protein